MDLLKKNPAVEGIKSSLFNQEYNIIFAREAYIYFLEGASPPGVLIATMYSWASFQKQRFV